MRGTAGLVEATPSDGEGGKGKGECHKNEGVMIRDVHSQQRRQFHARHDGRKEEVLATIPQRGGDTALEVVMAHDPGDGTAVELRYLVWGVGVGWYRQQTLRLDGTTARGLIQALGIVRRRMESQSLEGLTHEVLPFPQPGSHRESAATA
jgi:hypothetical protein